MRRIDVDKGSAHAYSRGGWSGDSDSNAGLRASTISLLMSIAYVDVEGIISRRCRLCIPLEWSNYRNKRQQTLKRRGQIFQSTNVMDEQDCNGMAKSSPTKGEDMPGFEQANAFIVGGLSMPQSSIASQYMASLSHGLISVGKRVFWKRGLLRKLHFLENLVISEIQGIL